MDFGSITFIVWFLPIFLVVYCCVPKGMYQSMTLILGTLIFYGSSYIKWLPLLIVLTALTIFAAMLIEKYQKYGLYGSVAIFVLLLCWNKSSTHLMPGISFLIFTILSFLIDLYRKQIRNIHVYDVCAYVLCFPKLISGPIVRMYHMKQQKTDVLRTRTEQIESGLACFIVGLGYKALIANPLSGLFYQVQTIGIDSISTPLAWLGIVGFGLQLYFDFQGYSLMAIGIGQCLGYTFPKNFDTPYLSVSVSEFYRRWHITLGQWFRDYVYIPLGGNRKGTVFTICNLFLVWLLTGLWHGIGLNFVIWALFLCMFVIIEKVFLKHYLQQYRIIGHIYTIFVIMLSWVFFALSNTQDITLYFLRLFAPILHHEGVNVATGDFVKYITQYAPFLIAGIICVFPFVETILQKSYHHWWCRFILFVIFWLSMYQLSSGLNNPFLYFSF